MQTVVQQKCFRYSFTLSILEINLKLPFFCEAQVQWGKGSKKVKKTCNVTKMSPNQQQKKGYFRLQVNQQIHCEYSCYFDCQRKALSSKESSIRIILKQGQDIKLGGSVVFDLTENLRNPYATGFMNFVSRIEKCPDKQARMKFQIKYSFLGQKSRSTLSRSPSPSHYSTIRSQQQQTFGSYNINVEYPKQQSHRYQSSLMKSSSSAIQQPSSTLSNHSPHFRFSQQQTQLTDLAQLSFQNLATSPRDHTQPSKDTDTYDTDGDIIFVKNQLRLKTKELTFLKEENALLKASMDNEHRNSNQKLLKVMNQLNVAESERNRLEIACSELNKEKQEIFLQKKQLQHKQLHLQTLVSKKQLQFQVLMDQHKKRNIDLEDQNNDLKDKMLAMQQQIFNLQKQFNIQVTLPKQDYIQQRGKLQSKILRQQEHIRELERNIQQSIQKIHIFQSNYQTMKLENDHFHERYLNLERQSRQNQEHAHNAYEILLQKYQNLEKQLAETQDKYSDLHFQYNGVEREKSKDFEFMRRKFDSLRIKLDKYEQKERVQKNLQYQVQQLKRQMIEQANELKQLQASKDSQKNRLQNLVAELQGQLDLKKTQLNDTTSKYKQQIMTLTHRLAPLEQQINQKDKEIAQLREKVNQAYGQTKKYSVGGFSSNRLKQQISHAKQQLLKKESQIRLLRTQIQEKQSEIQLHKVSLKAYIQQASDNSKLSIQRENQFKAKISALQQAIRQYARQSIESDIDLQRKHSTVKDSIFSGATESERRQQRQKGVQLQKSK